MQCIEPCQSLPFQLADKLDSALEIVLLQQLFKLLAVSVLEAVARKAGLNDYALIAKLIKASIRVCASCWPSAALRSTPSMAFAGCHQAQWGGHAHPIYAEQFASNTGVDHACF